jgi:CRISPR/Cas system CSM-associated protein Csm3 (group 7 of RAMP superfamily)
MEKHIHILTGKLKLYSPVIIGSGKSEETDLDLLLDAQGKPFIPGTSLAGVLRHLSINYLTDDEINLLWGYTKTEKAQQSILHFSDLPVCENIKIGTRTGVKIDTCTGRAAEKFLYEYQIIENGTFAFHLEAIDKDGQNYDKIKKAFSLFRALFKEKIRIGAKTTSGFGLIGIDDEKHLNYYFLKLNNKQSFIDWINGNYESYLSELNNLPEIKGTKPKVFRLEANMYLKTSFIIRDYSVDPSRPDAVSLHSNGIPVISGPSLKGALRSRAERIINTLGYSIDNARYEAITESLLNNLFGAASKRQGNSKRGKLFVNEISLKDYPLEQQTRIKIDRFTGGALGSALLEEMPVFSNKESSLIKIILTIEDYEDWEVGLVLLLLKDLWTGDLPVGGEKAIGRGVFEGSSAKLYFITHQDNSLSEESFEIKYSNIDQNNNKKIIIKKQDNQIGNDCLKVLNKYIKALENRIREENQKILVENINHNQVNNRQPAK